MKILRKFWLSLQKTKAFHHKEIPIPMLSFKSNRNLKSFLVKAKLPPSLDCQITHLPSIEFPSIHRALTLLNIWRILKLSNTCDYTLFCINLYIIITYLHYTNITINLTNHNQCTLSILHIQHCTSCLRSFPTCPASSSLAILP